MNLYQEYKNSIIDFVYLYDDIYIKTYAIIQKDDKFYQLYLNQFNYMWQGDKVLQKLHGRGYIPLEVALQKYNIEYIEELEETKTKKKTNFLRKRK